MVSSRSRRTPCPSGTYRCGSRCSGTRNRHGIDESVHRPSRTTENGRLSRNRPARECGILQEIRVPLQRKKNNPGPPVFVWGEKKKKFFIVFFWFGTPPTFFPPGPAP